MKENFCRALIRQRVNSRWRRRCSIVSRLTYGAMRQGMIWFSSPSKFIIQVGLPSRVCQTCADQLTRALLHHHQLGTWPVLPHVTKFDWSANQTEKSADRECTLAQTLPSLCTISAKHGFLLVPEHTDENRVSPPIGDFHTKKHQVAND